MAGNSFFCNKMGVFVTALNSGSNGNCYYIGNERDSILVDVGISCREVEKRMKRLALDLKKIRAIFISHEHADHIRGLRVLSKKYQLPVYITPKTLAGAKLFPENPLFVAFRSHETIEVGTLKVKCFPKWHDAADPHSFVVTHEEINIGVFTDIGEPCEHVIEHFKQCHAIFLETNYDDDMLENGRYPYHLKARIKSKNGHLSNRQAYKLFTDHYSEKLSHLFLSHLSQDNNHPEAVMNLFSRNMNGTKVILTSRYEEIPIVEIKEEMKGQLGLF